MELLAIIVVVFSLLVNLMKDQATKLENIGIPPVTLSDISEDNIRVVEREGLSLLFMEAPFPSMIAKTIQLTTALLHNFCHFFKAFESSQVEDSCANK